MTDAPLDLRPLCGYCGHRDSKVHATEHGPNDEEPTWCPDCPVCQAEGDPAEWQRHLAT